MDRVFNQLVFTLAKDEDGERVWTDFQEFDSALTYAQLIRCVNEAGLMEVLTGAIGGEKA